MSDFTKEMNVNRDAWNIKTPHHLKSDFYDLENFKNGATSLRHIELDELGDVKGKSLLHLQCHFGQDTLSFARLGAEVTGIDISDVAIATANSLSKELDIKAEFLCANVYDTLSVINKKYDVVFTSYGVIGWLPDINEWGRIISESLKPGGTFYIVEFHPFVWMMDDNYEKFEYSYFHDNKPLEFDVDGTYTDRDAKISYKNFNWIHSLSDVLNTLISNGLEIEYMNEYPYSVYDCFANMDKVGEQKWVFKNHKDMIPYLFSIKATKK